MNTLANDSLLNISISRIEPSLINATCRECGEVVKIADNVITHACLTEL